ncbi:RiPP maturation radical SAM C-methyltransferase [Saccharopolyspora dendranthemae]|uniref:Ribosomal peptide maturation radical SAM protein 1 n=1 Tax=Saccharopolyspora dendranthemae TaxID=1181886 RepID=A0A561V829_9PSEU|nr:RiPP maturation radical SAM C-methyltransferase [Saccharopolyspora dendranthemae]TWG07765.1 ribosomal peptide maturation radical SAM protein 1 [Saccharopolyspora dendranthemae]
MDVTLVNMPWASVSYPSLACGILKSAVERRGHSATVVDANLDFSEWMHHEMGTGLREYDFFSLDSYFQGCGDWVFTSALYDDGAWRVEEFRAAHGDDIEGALVDLCVRLHELVPDWISSYARRLAESAGSVVGFTTTFQQNAASLALARELKRIDPALRTVFGGANCEGPQGAAWHRNFEFVDFVVRGEGERAFPELLDRLAHGEGTQSVPGLCWRDGSEVGATDPNASPLAPKEIVSPDFGDYFDRYPTFSVAAEVEPKLVVEGARGCWWGEKHHCTFCGLNGSFMEFRSKSPGRFHDELLDLATRHQVLDIYLVDNILDMSYFNTVLPKLEESGCDLRIQCEVKSNLRVDQMRQLVKSGVVQVQPGIESLSGHVLRIMDKGVSGCQNVRFLRDASSLGITVMWNYLYGFPGESDADYRQVIDQMPALHHLPPMDGADRIALERFSPYFDRPELGFPKRSPDPQYARNYDLPPEELADIAYLFTGDPTGIGREVENILLDAVDAWRTAHLANELECVRVGSEILILEDRPAFGQREHVVATDDVPLFEMLDRPRSLPKLEGRFGPRVRDTLMSWRESGLIFADDEHFVHVVPEANNQGELRMR